MTCLPNLENLEGSAEGGSVRDTVSIVISGGVSGKNTVGSLKLPLFDQACTYSILSSYSKATFPAKCTPWVQLPTAAIVAAAVTAHVRPDVWYLLELFDTDKDGEVNYRELKVTIRGVRTGSPKTSEVAYSRSLRVSRRITVY